MKRFVRSEGYARARLVSAAFFILFGGIVIVRTVERTGLIWQAMPAFVLGSAMIALGAFRYRDYLVRNRR